jgi:hypothetical protein
MSDPLDLREDVEHMQRSLHARFSTPFLRRLAGQLFLPETTLVVHKLPRAEVEEMEYASVEGLEGNELRVYAAVTRQLWSARAVRLEDGTPLIDPSRLRKL